MCKVHVLTKVHVDPLGLTCQWARVAELGPRQLFLEKPMIPTSFCGEGAVGGELALNYALAPIW